MSGVECTCTATRHITHKRVRPSEDLTNELTLYVAANFQNFAILLQLRVQLHTPQAWVVAAKPANEAGAVLYSLFGTFSA